jgi:hypothetical protein
LDIGEINRRENTAAGTPARIGSDRSNARCAWLEGAMSILRTAAADVEENAIVREGACPSDSTTPDVAAGSSSEIKTSF